MKVVAAINGTLTSENMALYALQYAKIQSLPLLLLHIENKKDNIGDVQRSIDNLSIIAASLEVELQSSIFQSSLENSISRLLDTSSVDLIFSSTRKEKHFISNSFSERLINMKFAVDIAVVRIVKMSHLVGPESMILAIQKDRLSVKKFTFFSILASAYHANGEIYSVTNMSRMQLAKQNRALARQQLALINHNLRHYIQLSRFMPFKLHIKHDFTHTETQSILSHLARSEADLAVVGGRRLSLKSFFKRTMPIEALMRDSTLNIIAYYPYER